MLGSIFSAYFILTIATAFFAVIPFETIRQYSTSVDSTGIVSADIDGDGDIDLVISNRGTSTVSVLYNDGTGFFQTAINYQTGIVPRYVDGADFDHDGDFDLCTPDYDGETTTVLMNDGLGTFTIHAQYDTFVPSFLWVDDLDQDGHADILVTHWDEIADPPSQNSALFTPLFNDGNGNFSKGDSSWIGKQPRGGASADLNGDGIKDVVIVNYLSKTVSILMGLGKRQWTDEIVIQLSGQPRYVIVHDFDADLDIDMAVIDKEENHFLVFHNDGNANFALEDTHATSNHPHSMDGGDVDNDGDIDVVVTHVGSSQQLLFLNDGTGQFASPQVLIMTGGPAEVQFTDVNEDNLLDIVSANVNWEDRGASVLRQGICEGEDCNDNGISDYCELPDCNMNALPDDCDITSGFSTDANSNGIPDECELDCNGNGFPDSYDISSGLSGDCNLNGVPDDCDWIVLGDCDNDGLLDGCEIDDNNDYIPDDCQCMADFTGDGTVKIHDLLQLISFWGELPPPHSDPLPHDLNQDREINIHDLLLLVGAWGDCPDATLPQIEGACCLGSAMCGELLETACHVRGGLYMGDNTSCQNIDCTLP